MALVTLVVCFYLFCLTIHTDDLLNSQLINTAVSQDWEEETEG